MAQHDMVIANQTFPDTRTDLNNALAALVSTSIGSSAPATPYDGQLWIDNAATPWAIKVYVLATTTWITRGYINQSAAAMAGANALFAITDARTGTTENLAHADHGQFVTFSNTSAVASSLPNITATVCPSGWSCIAVNKNTGVVTITPTTVTINGLSSIKLYKNQGVLIWSDGTNYQCASLGYDTAGLGIYVWNVGSGGWEPTTTAGATKSKVEGATYKVNLPYVEFAASGTTHAQLIAVMPKSWNGGTIKFRHWGLAGSGAGDALLKLKGRAFASGDGYDAADFGTEQTALLSTASTTLVKRSAQSSAITIAGSPAGEQLVVLDLFRVAGAGTDTLSGTYRMINCEIELSVDKKNDE